MPRGTPDADGRLIVALQRNAWRLCVLATLVCWALVALAWGSLRTVFHAAGVAAVLVAWLRQLVAGSPPHAGAAA